jgi:hypothetical protein
MGCILTGFVSIVRGRDRLRLLSPTCPFKGSKTYPFLLLGLKKFSGFDSSTVTFCIY